MPCMVGIAHGIGVTPNDSTQVALALALMGGNLEATIKNFKAKIALASLVCYNELHMFFSVLWLNCVFRIKALFGFCPKAKGVCPRLCACTLHQDEQRLP